MCALGMPHVIGCTVNGGGWKWAMVVGSIACMSREDGQAIAGSIRTGRVTQGIIDVLPDWKFDMAASRSESVWCLQMMPTSLWWLRCLDIK